MFEHFILDLGGVGKKTILKRQNGKEDLGIDLWFGGVLHPEQQDLRG